MDVRWRPQSRPPGSSCGPTSGPWGISHSGRVSSPRWPRNPGWDRWVGGRRSRQCWTRSTCSSVRWWSCSPLGSRTCQTCRGSRTRSACGGSLSWCPGNVVRCFKSGPCSFRNVVYECIKLDLWLSRCSNRFRILTILLQIVKAIIDVKQCLS